MSKSIISIKEVNSWYGDKHVLKNVSMDIEPNKITAFIGPSACGKTTLLKSINRMNDLIPSFRISGTINVEDVDIYKEINKAVELMQHRKRVGMVFQSPNPLPMSIYRNLALPIEENFDKLGKEKMMEIILSSLTATHLHDEVCNRLNSSAMSLSGGQQQRLCIARALTINPEIILFDEPCSALDPISTYKIEELLNELKEKYTIVIVTHNMEQATRISDNVAFFYHGELIEYGTTEQIFFELKQELTQKYVTGKF